MEGPSTEVRSNSAGCTPSYKLEIFAGISVNHPLGQVSCQNTLLTPLSSLDAAQIDITVEGGIPVQIFSGGYKNGSHNPSWATEGLVVLADNIPTGAGSLS